MARGEFVIVFDSDDYIAPYCLRQRVEMLSKRPELDFMVFPSGVYVDNRFVTAPHPYDFGYRVAEDDVKMFASRRLPFIVWNNIYRTESLRRNSLTWDTGLLSLQDADFNISAIAAGLRYDYADGALQDYGYRIITTSSISKKINSQAHVDSHVLANSKMYDAVRSIAGHKWDSALYDGMLRIYNQGMTGKGINRSLADALAESVRERNSPLASAQDADKPHDAAPEDSSGTPGTTAARSFLSYQRVALAQEEDGDDQHHPGETQTIT